MSGVETLLTDVESALAQLITYGLARRQTLASLTALAYDPMLHGLRYVPNQGVYEWQGFSTTTADGVNVVASTRQSMGRWVKVVTNWTYGAGGTNLGAKTTGYLLAVEVYDSDDIEEMLTRVQDRTPAVLLRFTGDAPTSDALLPGCFYKDPLDFVVNIITNNLRGGTTATQGSPIAAESAADPGAHRTIGDLRRLICGVSPAFGITGVERMEIGAATRVDEDQDRRLFTYAMTVTARTSFKIDDEDLVTPSLGLQPALTSTPRVFDKDNYVSSGCSLVEGLGAGLNRTIEAGVVTIGGVVVTTIDTSVTFAADTDTYRDLSSAGVWSFSAVAVFEKPPAIPTDYIRIGLTRTYDTGIEADVALCSYSIPFGQPIVISPA